MQGRFIAFEGIDGSGKTTAIAAAAAAVQAKGHAVLATKEESDGLTGQWVQTSIRDRLEPLATAFLFLADRAAHVPQITAALSEGRHVLCDRFLHSTLAYQGVTLEGRVEDPVGFLRRLHEPWCPLPDLVLLFRGDPEACVARTQGRGSEASRYEKAAFLERVQDLYLSLAREEPQRFVVLDAERPLEAVSTEAIQVVLDSLGAPPAT